MATRRGIAPTTAGASAELVWLAMNRHAVAGILSRPAMRTRIPTARTKNKMPFTPAQYSGFGLREISVYSNSGGPASSAYSDRKMPTNAVRHMDAQHSLRGHSRRQAAELFRRGSIKNSLRKRCRHGLRGSAQNSFADAARFFAGMAVLVDLIEFLASFAETKFQRDFLFVPANRQAQRVARLLRINPALR